jgi:hypothetical protein
MNEVTNETNREEGLDQEAKFILQFFIFLGAIGIGCVAAWYFGKIIGTIVAFTILALGRTLGGKEGSGSTKANRVSDTKVG